jgi:hypothetical protein
MASAVWLASAVADWAEVFDFAPQPARPIMAVATSPIAKNVRDFIASPWRMKGHSLLRIQPIDATH